MARHLLHLLGRTTLIAGCAAAEPQKLLRAQPAEPQRLEVLIEPDTVPAFQQILKPLPTENDDEPDVQGLEAIEAAHADARIQSASHGFINASQYSCTRRMQSIMPRSPGPIR